MPMKKVSYAQRLWNDTQTKCYLCGVEFTSKNRKNADHCHITGEYRGAACAYCNQNILSLKGMSIPILFHNFSGYDSRLLMKHIEDLEVSVIANSTEQIKCASILFVRDGKVQKGVARFIDSLAFLNSSLDKLSSLLLSEDKEYLRHYLMYKCVVKVRGRQAVDMLYDGRQRHDGEMQELIQERRQNYCYVGTGNLSPQDDDYHNKIYEDVQVSMLEQIRMERAIELITKKGVFPYNWLDSIDKLDVTSPPSEADFYNTLTEQQRSDEDYQYVKCLGSF